MDARATASLVRRIVDDCDRYLADRFGGAARSDGLTKDISERIKRREQTAQEKDE